jgi:hypothetical protein
VTNLSSSIRALALALALALTVSPAAASELAQFNTAVAGAYGFYRSALFYLRTGNTMVAGFELEQMQERWQAVEDRFAARPPDAFADDASFPDVLHDVGRRTRDAAQAATAGDGDGAAKALEPIRGWLAGLRERAGVRVFSDCIDEVGAAMDALYVFRKTPPDLSDPDQVNAVKARAAVLDYLLRRCDREADPAVRADGEFRRLVDGASAAVAAMFKALDRRDTTAVINVLRELRSFDHILYLRFG